MDVEELKRLRDELVKLRPAADDPARYGEIRDVADSIRKVAEEG